MQNLLQEYSVSSQYFAPRGRERLMFLGEQIAQRHLHFNDRLIGIVGDAGSGKSSLIKGMFPGLELSNDDDILNPRKIMQVREGLDDFKEAGSYHIDMRFQTAFTQMYEIVDFVKSLLHKKRRVIIEHFDLLYPALGINADIIVGIGEEIIVTRPSVFGPLPASIYEIVHKSLTYRKMAHTAEDVTMQVLEDEFNVSKDCYFSSDIRKGFVLKFFKEPVIDFEKLSGKIEETLSKSMPVSYYDENHIKIGERVVVCDGPRLHVSNTSKVLNFSLVKRLVKDPKTSTWCLVGLIDNNSEDLENRNTVHFLKRKD
ncbi:MAG: lantibiotic ABC transporter [Bacteroidetes bacterium 41-46]|nr:MAG: lantibiotic ABC transporter [Bacteroidetes bacterium 41-46]